jgi:hypothetical protein
MPLLVNRLEDLYRQMWLDYERGELPRPDLSNLDVYLEVGRQVKHEEIEVQTIADYHSWWRDNMTKRHQFRPIPRDNRIWK